MSFSGSSEASATPKLLKRKSLVYVDIPPSPLHSSFSNKSSLQKMSKRKGVPQTPLSTRKLNTNEAPVSSEDIISIKRRKISSGKSTKTPYVLIEKKGAQKSSGTNFDPDFPDGFFYCHQCYKKRAKDVELQCTVNENVPCKAKYCKMCLKNRYGEDVDQIKRRGTSIEHSERVGHLSDIGYIWKCPKCADICNCCRCRKAKGLEPTGNLTNMARKNGTSAADLLAKDPNAKGIIGRKGAAISSNAEISLEAKKKSKEEAPRKKSEKAPPKEKPFKMPEAPIWKEVPTDLNISQAEDRFFIRESVLRLAPLMNISFKHLEELDEFDYLSDGGVKALILNLLSLIAADIDESNQRVFKDIMKKISGIGVNLNNLWNNLLEMRRHVPATILDFPNPAPSEIETYRTRNGGNIFQPIQFVPVLVGLAESAVKCSSARVEIDNGLRNIKECNKDYYALVRQENERWESIKSKDDVEKAKTSKEKPDEKYQNLRNEHKSILADLECEHKEKIQAYSPRFKPLGRDHEQRTYYISTTFHSKKGPTLEQINSFEKWSWLLAVWGKSTSDKEVPDIDEDDTNTRQEEKWWGFSEPKEIKKLAKWISASADLRQDHPQSGDSDIEMLEMLDSGASRLSSSLTDLSSLSDLSSLTCDEKDEDDMNVKENGGLIGPATKKEICELVKGLQEYSEYLEWRINSLSKSRSGGEINRNGSRNDGEVATKQFYGERR